MRADGESQLDPQETFFWSLSVRVEHLYVNGRVVTGTGHGLSGLIRIFRLQVVHELHRGGVGCQLQRPLTAGLQLKGYVNSPVDGQAQAVHTDLSVTPAFQKLLTASQLSPEISLHVDVDVVASFRELPGESLPQRVLDWVHLYSLGAGVCVRRACLREGGHAGVAWLCHVYFCASGLSLGSGGAKRGH